MAKKLEVEDLDLETDQGLVGTEGKKRTGSDTIQTPPAPTCAAKINTRMGKKETDMLKLRASRVGSCYF